jgi:Zn-dependent metalloprotease
MLRTAALIVSLFSCLSLSLRAQQAVPPQTSEVSIDQEGLNEGSPARQQELRDQQAWQAFKSNHPEWRAWFNEQTGMPHRAYGAPIAIEGNSLKAKAQSAIAQVLDPFTLNKEQLKLSNTRQGPSFQYVTYQQEYQGSPVFTSEVKLRFTADGQLTQFSLDYYPTISALPAEKLSDKAAVQAATADVKGKVSKTTVTDKEKIVPTNGEFRLAREVVVKGTNPEAGLPFNFRTLVDATTGKVLYRHNRIHQADFEDIPVAGTAVDQYPGKGDSTLNLRYLSVRVNGRQSFTDSSGTLSLEAPDGAQATLSLEGRYASVRDRGDQPPEVQTTLNANSPDTISFDSAAGLDQRSAYYHTNVVHDFMKEQMPNYTGLDKPLTVNTGIESERGCNAFYRPDQESMNYFEDNSNCPSFAKVNDIVYHEYGHAISNIFYRDQGGDDPNGAMQEAFSDLWAMAITDDPVVGKGASIGGRRDFIRRYDQNPKVYPEDLVGEVHSDGEILAGAFWQMRQNLDSLDQMSELLAATYYSLPDAVSGNEGQLYRDILIDVLTANDDDNNLNNGTPDGRAITQAFAKHGITLLGNLDFSHESRVFRDPGKPATFNAKLEGPRIRPVGELRLVYRLSGQEQWQTTAMTQNASGEAYTAQLPETDTGNLMLYYFELYDQQGNRTASFPGDVSENVLSSLPYYTLYGFKKVQIDHLNDGELWSVEGNAEGGTWVVERPVGSYEQGKPNTPGNVVQPLEDHSEGPENACAVTGNAPSESIAPGFADVDRGETRLTSPYYLVDTLKEPVIGYHRWFTNATGLNPGIDPLRVQIQARSDSRWKTVSLTYESDRSWRQRLIDVHKAVGKEAREVRLRFTAMDEVQNMPRDGQSIVEAAVDDVVLYDRSDQFKASDPSTGLAEQSRQSAGDLKAYPNPTSGVLRLERPADAGATSAQIINAQGQVIRTLKLKGGSQTIDLSAAGQGKGLYMVRWFDQGQVHTRKILYQ